MKTGSKVKNGGGFFILDLQQIDRIVEMDGGAEELMAYLVLSRGTGQSRTVSTHGANSISVRTDMTFYRAEQSLTWLANSGFISKAAAASDEVSKKRKPRWIIPITPNQQELALSNALLDGIGKGMQNPPLARIYNELAMGQHCVLPDARLDALMLLLRLYQHHHLADLGGVNPRLGLYRQWEETKNSNGNTIEDIAGTNAALFEIKYSSTLVFPTFCNDSLFYIPDAGERKIRFGDAFHNLTKLGLVYEVIQIWSADPIKSPKAYPLYTLYVRDRHARESDPYLSKEIHNFALRRGCLDEYSEFSDSENSANIINTGRFRYIATKTEGGFPIGIFRLRFRPHTRDTGKGLAAERHRVDQWASVLSKL